MNKRARLGLALVMIAAALFVLQNRRAAEAPPPAPAPSAQAALVVAPEVKTPGPRDVLVAKHNLDPGLVSRLTTAEFELRTIPDAMPLPESRLVIRTPDQLKDKALVEPILQGEILLKTRFADARTAQRSKKLSDIVPDGYRAVSIDVDAVTGGVGFADQGDIVDVAATQVRSGKPLTRIILPNVKVLARGYSYRIVDRPAGLDRTVRGENVLMVYTLEVPTALALRVAYIMDDRPFNRFRLLLKNRDDRMATYSPGVRLRDVLLDEPRSVTPADASVLAENQELEVYRGLALTTETMEDRTVAAGTAQLALAASRLEASVKPAAETETGRRAIQAREAIGRNLPTYR